MLNYSNLSDVEFEYLCQDIMQRKLNVSLHKYAVGRDNGIDLCDDSIKKSIVIQVKHYINSTVSNLINTLKTEVKKVNKLNPKQYYICCSKALSPQKVNEIYNMFSPFMDSSSNIITISDIDDFLNASENFDILKKHYKLWIESTGILENIIHNDTFIDCEVLFSTIEKDRQVFVPTIAYYESLKLLDKRNTLFIVGNPGVGKTLTSKMLILHYAANGYKVRYTTNTSDLQTLKKNISQNPEEKEIILIDDCFGQAYFKMKETQSNELTALIKYVGIATNKLLILNSRITIFKEAKNQCLELVSAIECDQSKVFVIDMNEISDVEKAKILYNHFYFNKVGKEYFEDIRKDRRYLSIVKHKNYNPRIIEFICNSHRYESVEPNQYYQFIMLHLNNPKEIWRNEYENRLQKVDRILLSIIYSFSDLETNIDLIQKNFNKRISNESDIDITINQFEASLNRLLDGFVILVSNGKDKRLSVANPSINDYFDSRFKENFAERNALIDNSIHIKQIYRLTTDAEYELWWKNTLINHSVKDYIFSDEYQRNANIVYFLSVTQVLDAYYIYNIIDFFNSPTGIYHNGATEINAEEIIESIFSFPDMIEYYGIVQFLQKEENLRSFLATFDLQSQIQVLNIINSFFENRAYFASISIEILKETIENYCEAVDADDYDPDVSGSVDFASSYGEFGMEVDEYEAAIGIEYEVKECVKDEIYKLIGELPSDIVIDEKYIDELDISVYGASHLVDAYIADNDSDYEYDNYIPYRCNDEEIQNIFERDYN